MPHAPRELIVLRQPDIDGRENMRRDVALLETCPPQVVGILRLYSWVRPTISLGKMQKAEDLLDLPACRRDGIDIVSRPTGGRAILHAEEITYCFVGHTTQAPFDTGLQDTHRLLAECLQGGLARLGIATTLSRPTHDPGRRLIRQPCFSSAGRAEILVDGRKLLGSAQRRTRHAFLQHGSLLLGPAHTRIVEYLLETSRDVEQAQALRQRLQAGTTYLGELLEEVPSFEPLCDALAAGFATRLRARVATPTDSAASGLFHAVAASPTR